MAQSFSNETQELDCPNCGASYELPNFGDYATCAYCGSGFLVPESVRKNTPNAFANTTTVDFSVPATRVNVGRWVMWLVIIIVVTTVVPVVCGLFAAFCGALAPLVALFFDR